jgi:creatinine amidohydrolase
MKLQYCSWQEVADYLQRSTTIIIPIGSTEQHGPNGLIGTDAICPETIADGVAEKIDMLIAPTISIGMAQHHLGFPGTIALRPSTLISLLVDVLNSLSVHGFEKIYFLNGHGGNIASIQSAFSEFYGQSSFSNEPTDSVVPHTRLVNWYQGQRVKEYSRRNYPEAEGRHATVSEVSLTYFAHPDQVKNVEMSPKNAPVDSYRDARDFRNKFPDGRIGSDPSRATIAHGEQIFAAAVKDVLKDIQEFMGK